jgi:hypothetical protein
VTPAAKGENAAPNSNSGVQGQGTADGRKTGSGDATGKKDPTPKSTPAASSDKKIDGQTYARYQPGKTPPKSWPKPSGKGWRWNPKGYHEKGKERRHYHKPDEGHRQGHWDREDRKGNPIGRDYNTFSKTVWETVGDAIPSDATLDKAGKVFTGIGVVAGAAAGGGIVVVAGEAALATFTSAAAAGTVVIIAP